jgi:Amt family ammonium transporter
MAATAADLAFLQKEIDGIKAEHGEALDTIWMLLAGLLVFFMHAGFSLLESGSVRFKNSQNILAKNLIVVTVGFLCWYVMGWPMAYGIPEKDLNKFGGHAQFVMDGFWDDKKLFRNWFFQGAFCATGGTIVSGAMAERTQLKGFGIYIIMMTSFIYPLVAYWGWSGSGFLLYTDDAGASVSAFGSAYMDFAGSGIVHLVGGIGALVGSITVGARKGRFGNSVKADDFDAQSVPFQVLGTFCLWFGWYGFNPGSTLSMKTAEDAHKAGLVAVNTTLAPCVAGLIVFGLRALVVSPKSLDVGGFCNGILAGLVSITAGCAFVKPWESVLIGAVGGFAYQGSSMLLKKLNIDDVVDAFPVHGVCGMWGVLALGLFGNPDEGMGGNGLFYGGDQLRVQVMAVLIIVAWVGLFSAALFIPLRFLGMLRLGDDFQDKGADVMEHSPRRACHVDPAWKDDEETKEKKVPVADEPLKQETSDDMREEVAKRLSLASTEAPSSSSAEATTEFEEYI